MHYNKFTIEYIEAVRINLKIEINDFGDAVYFPDKITDLDILNLKTDLERIWNDRESSIDIICSKKESLIQSGLFGLVNDLGTALKVGFLMSDRVVLIDYLYERLLLKNSPHSIDRTHLGVISSSLVNILPLARNGRVVIIQTPFSWHSEAKQIISEVNDRICMTPHLMSLLNMLSISKHCNLHPYTIAESEEHYSLIVNSHIDSVDAIGRDGGASSYQSILGALLSEKLLNGAELKFLENISLIEYVEVVKSNKEFYSKYLSSITTGGSINASYNIDNIKNQINQAIKEKNATHLKAVTKQIGNIGCACGAAVTLASCVTVVSAPLNIAGAILALSGALTNLLNDNKNNEDIIISVFKKLHDRQ